MALKIKAIPTLKGKEAERFVKNRFQQAGENSPCHIEKSQYVVSMGFLLDKCSFFP